MFTDYVKIFIKAGNGGNGCVSFHREKYVAKGGPDGGDGGRGGNIVFKVDEGINTLLAFRYKRKFVAGNGGDGAKSKFHGANAEDLVIMVPPGTVIKDAETERVIKDMNTLEPFICLKGGKGGWGNKHFATPTRQIPRFAKNGIEGEGKEVILELKMLADAGLVGLPNAGKSSILRMMSAAKPKVANYRFTTLTPMLGVVKTGEGKGFVCADIPGLIEGASEGAGLGHEFLRHVDRCRALIHVVDVAGSEYRSPIDDIELINGELVKYSKELASRPQIIAANKTDILDKESEEYKKFVEYTEKNGLDVIYVSAATGEGCDELIKAVSDLLDTLPPPITYESEISEETELLEDKEDDITVRKEDGVYYVEGKWLYKLMGRINFDDRESLAYFDRMMRKKNIFTKMEEAGIGDGDTVNLYDFEFEYIK